MYHLVYTSVASEPFSDAALMSLLVQSRKSNLRLGITGFLVYQPDAFMQVLEGEKAAVIELFGAICSDTRHHHVVTLVANPVLARLFSDWSMGFRTLESEHFGPLDGEKCPQRCPAAYWTQRGGSAAIDLLSSFRVGI